MEKLRIKFSWTVLILNFLAFSAALLTEESALLFPVIYFAYLVFYQKEKIFTKRNAIISAGWIIISMVWSIVRSIVIHSNFNGFYSVEDIALGVMSYSGKLVFRFDLSPYPVPENVVPIYGAIVLSGLALLITFKKIKKKFLFRRFMVSFVGMSDFH